MNIGSLCRFYIPSPLIIYASDKQPNSLQIYSLLISKSSLKRKQVDLQAIKEKFSTEPLKVQDEIAHKCSLRNSENSNFGIL